MRQRLEFFYIQNVVPLLIKEFGYKNLNEVPKLKKIVINRGFDESCQNKKILDLLLVEFMTITGQKPCLRRSQKSIASFKIKESMPVGMIVTLRGKKMYSFLDRLINLVLPRIRDFQGISNKSFDGFGNYSLSLSEQTMFPEVEFDKLVKLEGMDINIVTTAKDNKQGLFLLKHLGMPFKF